MVFPRNGSRQDQPRNCGLLQQRKAISTPRPVMGQPPGPENVPQHRRRHKPKRGRAPRSSSRLGPLSNRVEHGPRHAFTGSARRPIGGPLFHEERVCQRGLVTPRPSSASLTWRPARATTSRPAAYALPRPPNSSPRGAGLLGQCRQGAVVALQQTTTRGGVPGGAPGYCASNSNVLLLISDLVEHPTINGRRLAGVEDHLRDSSNLRTRSSKKVAATGTKGSAVPIRHLGGIRAPAGPRAKACTAGHQQSWRRGPTPSGRLPRTSPSGELVTRPRLAAPGPRTQNNHARGAEPHRQAPPQHRQLPVTTNQRREHPCLLRQPRSV